MTDIPIWLSRARLALKAGLKSVLWPVGLFVPRPAGMRVLFYHRVNDAPLADLGAVSRELSVPVDAFRRQMDWLARKGYRTVRLGEVAAMLEGRELLDPKAVLITFDDGYLDNLENASGILAAHGFSAVVFPVVDLIGKDNRGWQFADPPGQGRFMDADQLRAWCAAGHEIGSHTLTHPNLAALDGVALEAELARSRAAFRERFGTTCEAVAYPFGDVTDTVRSAAAKAGYSLGFTTRAGVTPPGWQMLDIRRTEVSRSDPFPVFLAKMRGWLDWTGMRDSQAYRGLLRASYRMFELPVAAVRNWAART